METPPIPELDHFRVYNVDVPVEETVSLYGQFDRQIKEYNLTNIDHFGVPVSKNRVPPLDEEAFLNWYVLEPLPGTRPERPRRVEIYNQFGYQSLRVEEPTLLLVPSALTSPGDPGTVPENLNHFKCYRVTDFKPPAATTVSLDDRYRSDPEIMVGITLLFGVPVEKTHDGILTEIPDKEAHLTVYAINRINFNAGEDVTDQFADVHHLSIDATGMLAVPTNKLNWAYE